MDGRGAGLSSRHELSLPNCSHVFCGSCLFLNQPKLVRSFQIGYWLPSFLKKPLREQPCNNPQEQVGVSFLGNPPTFLMVLLCHPKMGSLPKKTSQPLSGRGGPLGLAVTQVGTAMVAHAGSMITELRSGGWDRWFRSLLLLLFFSRGVGVRGDPV